MARPATGQVLERRTARGTTYAIRFRAYGRREYLTLGSTADGWSRQRVEKELENVLADVRRGIWRPAPEPVEQRPEPSFHEFASEWFEAKRRELRPNTIAAYQWEISYHLLPFFARHPLSQITVEEVDRYRTAKVREREGGRRLSNETINKTLTRLAQILEVALEYGYIERNPAAGKRRRLKVSRPQRTYIDRAEQIEALLNAAGRLDAAARADHRALGRRPLLSTLVFAGLRIGELCELRWRQVDLASGRLWVGEAKTDAGVREIELLPALRDELAAHKAGSRYQAGDDYVFGTTQGRRQGATNIRRRVLGRAVEGANEALNETNQAPLPANLTPHSLRRTFASLLFAIGRTAPEVMEQLGHADPKLTLRIYARAMRRDADVGAALQVLVGFEPSDGIASLSSVRGIARLPSNAALGGAATTEG